MVSRDMIGYCRVDLHRGPRYPSTTLRLTGSVHYGVEAALPNGANTPWGLNSQGPSNAMQSDTLPANG